MRILAITRAHNAGETLADTLDSLATFSDDIYAIDDRSTDDTAAILANHPAVTNVVRARADLPSTPWLIPESTGLELLYRMADFCRPDWIVMVDADWTFQMDINIREVLARTPNDVAALMCPMVSRWDDPEYPDMVPVMGTAEALRGPFWRWYPGLYPGEKLMHNSHWPANITDHGRIGQLNGIRLTHNGWSTLRERISRVEHYMRLDRIFGTTSVWPMIGLCCSAMHLTKLTCSKPTTSGGCAATSTGPSRRHGCRLRRSHARLAGGTDPARTVFIPVSTSLLTSAAQSTPSYLELFAAQAKLTSCTR